MKRTSLILNYYANEQYDHIKPKQLVSAYTGWVAQQKVKQRRWMLQGLKQLPVSRRPWEQLHSGNLRFGTKCPQGASKFRTHTVLVEEGQD